MTKYGGGLYGEETYGDETLTPDGAVQWICQIAWDGSYSGTNEAGWMVGCRIRRGREYIVSSAASGIEPMQAGTATLTLDNGDGRYDPYNTSSPLYPNVLPGKMILIEVKDVTSGITYPVFAGHVSNIKPTSDRKQVTITAADGLQWLQDQELTMATITGTTISAAATAVLNAAGYPWPKTINAWAQPLPIFDPSPATYDPALKGVVRQPFTAAGVLRDLAEASLGTLFVDTGGTACYYPLNYAGMTTYDLDQAVLLKEIQIRQPWEDVRNKVRVQALRRGKRSLTAIWQLASPLEIASPGTAIIQITYKKSVDVSSPWWGTWLSNSAADGSGSDESNDTIPVLSEITSTSAKMTIVNGSGATVYMTRLSVSGREVVEIPSTKTAEDTTSIATYGPRRLSIENPWIQDAGYAQAFATLLKDTLKAPSKSPVIRIDSRPDTQYPVELMDKVHLTSAKLEIDATYCVGGIEHEWQVATGQSVLTTLYLQPVIYSGDAITPDVVYYPGVDLQPELPPTTTPASIVQSGDAIGLWLQEVLDIEDYTENVWTTLDLTTFSGMAYPDAGSWLDGAGQIVISEPGVYVYTVTVRMEVRYLLLSSDRTVIAGTLIMREFDTTFKARLVTNPADDDLHNNATAQIYYSYPMDAATYIPPGPTQSTELTAVSSGTLLLESLGTTKLYCQIWPRLSAGDLDWNNIFVDIVIHKIGDIPA